MGQAARPVGRPRRVQSPPGRPCSCLEVLIQAVDGRLVAVGLDVAVGVRRLRDRRMAELLLHPTEVRAVLQELGRKRVTAAVIPPVRQPGLGEQWLPDVPVSRGPSARAENSEARTRPLIIRLMWPSMLARALDSIMPGWLWEVDRHRLIQQRRRRLLLR